MGRPRLFEAPVARPQQRLFALDDLGEGGWLKAMRLEGYAVKAPKPTKKEIHPLNHAKVNALFEAARGDRLEALYIVAVMMGLREGELLGLKWEDVDLEAGTLSVRRSLSYTEKEPIFNNPKNGKGRNLKLTNTAMDALRRHKTAQNEERLRLGSLWEDHDLVFPSQTGRPLRAWSLIGGPFKRL